ncbi:hypothetical protein B9Z55_027779 [Caenorhabditis nigoni]|nr:hypothetical protein B9Z55_027779 [Caenorhabditis nigoni]
MYVLGPLIISSFVAGGVGLFTQNWYIIDGKARGIIPWHSKVRDSEIPKMLLVFLMVIICSVNIIPDFRREVFKTGYTIRAVNYLGFLSFFAFGAVSFTTWPVISITNNINSIQEPYGIGYSPVFCAGSEILSLIILLISMYLAKAFRCCNQAPPIDA